VKELNFLPRSFIEARRRRRILRMQALGIAAVLVALAAVLTAGHASLAQVEAKCANASGTRGLLDGQLLQMQQLKRKQEDLLRQQEIQRRLGNWIPRSSVLLLISRILPEGVGLLDVSLTPRKVDPQRRKELGLNETSPNVRSIGRARSWQADERTDAQDVLTEMVLTGVAPSDVHYTQTLAAMGTNPAFRNVTLVYARHRLVDDRILREFQVRCQLVEKQVEHSGD
jgi:hypothetical protein